MNPNDQVKIRLYTYKSFRHYGGREINTTSHICSAIFLFEQTDGTNVCQLCEDCAGYKIGSKIAILEKDFNL